MGFLDKVKNMFIEEVEEEEEEKEKEEKPAKEETPVKTEVTHVTITSPGGKKSDDMSLDDIDKINKYSDILENERKEKSKRPIFFTDHDFEDFESYAPRAPEKKQPTVSQKQTAYRESTPTTRTKFKPTPIISPVYGILDKNYHKEDIVSKQDVDYKSSDVLTVDSVRAKAFGNLEEELENTLYNKKSLDDLAHNENIVDDEMENEILSTSEKEEMLAQEAKINDLKTISESLDKELEDLVDKKEEMAKEKDQKIDNSDIDDDLDDDDLFNLIDSMYEERND